MTDEQLIENLRSRTWAGKCEAAAFRIEELRARVAELEASLSRADKRAMNAIADAEKRANWFASMALRGEELKFSPDDVVRLDKLIMGLMLKAPPLHDLIDTAVVVLCKAGKRLQVAEPRIAELEARIAELEAEQVKQCQTCDGRGEIGGFQGGTAPGYVTEACPDCAGAGHAKQQEADEAKQDSPWIDPNDKTQKQFLPWVGEKVFFCHAGMTYYGCHTGGSFQSFNPPKQFNTWSCRWMYPPKAAEKIQRAEAGGGK